MPYDITFILSTWNAVIYILIEKKKSHLKLINQYSFSGFEYPLNNLMSMLKCISLKYTGRS